MWYLTHLTSEAFQIKRPKAVALRTLRHPATILRRLFKRLKPNKHDNFKYFMK